MSLSCGWYTVRHYNVSPLISNQYPCNPTCFDRNVLLFKCDAVSAEVIVVLRSQQLYLANDNIDSPSISTISQYTGHLCDGWDRWTVWLSPRVVTRTNYLREGLCVLTVFVTHAHRVDIPEKVWLLTIWLQKVWKWHWEKWTAYA